VIDPAASEAGNTPGRATSRPVPRPLRAVADMARFGRASIDHQTAFTPSVSMGPSDMPLTRLL
jgi:hypothetical protein